MTWRVEVATNKEATTWADITAYVDRTSLAVGGTAHEIEIDTGSGFDAADDDGVTLSIPTRRVVRVIEDATTPDTVLFRGRSIGRALARGTLPIADANQKDVNLVDFNADLGGIPIARSFRPEETDHARIRVYLETFLQGTHRASTNLLDTYLQTTSPITLEKYVYEDATPATVFQHIIGETGKDCFVTVDGELFYGPGTSTVYAASLAITDVSPDSITTFAPIEPRGDEDGSEYASGVKVIYKGRKTTTVLDATSENAHDYWRITHTDESIPSLAAALRRGNKLLNEHKQDEIRYECAIQLRDDQVDLIKYGQTVSFRSAAAGVLSPVTVRVKRLLWEEAGPRTWLAHLELGFPKKVAGRLPPANRGPIEPFYPDVVASSAFAVLYFPSEANANWPPDLHFAGTGDAPPSGFPGAPKVGPLGYVTGGAASYPYTGLTATDDITNATIEGLASCAGAYAAATVTHTWTINKNGSPIATASQSRTFGEFPEYWAPSQLVKVVGASLASGDVITLKLATSGWPSSPSVPAGIATYEYLRINGTAVVTSPTDTPYPGQPVTETITSDGSTLVLQTNYPYTPNGIKVYAGGARIEPVQTDPTTGTFALPSALPAGTQIVVDYQVAMGDATGAGNSYTTSTAPQIVPYPLLGTGGDGTGDNVLHDDGTWKPSSSADGSDCCGDEVSPVDRALAALAVKLTTGGAPEIVQNVTAHEALAATITATMDSTPVAGNLLVAWHTARSGTGNSFDTPSGWTAHPSGTVDGGVDRAAMYYKISDGTESSIVFSLGAGTRHSLTVIEVAGDLALDASAENTGSSASIATGSVTPTTGQDAIIFGGAVINTGDSSHSMTPDSGWTELVDHMTDNCVEGCYHPLHWLASKIVASTSGSYNPSGTCSASAAYGGQTMAFLTTGSPTWTVPVPEAIDADDATYDTIAGAEVLRVDLLASYGIVRSRLRIACATSGSRTYTITGANAADFSDGVVLDSTTFTAIGSNTAQDIEFLWVFAGQFRYFQLDGDNETRRIHSWELYEASATDIIVTDPTISDAADLQTALDDIHAAAIPKAIVDAKGDLIAGSAADTPVRVAVGANGTALIADNTQAAGVRWGSVATSLDELSDVVITSPANADRIRFDGSTWRNSALRWSPVAVTDDAAHYYLLVDGTGTPILTEA